LGIAFVSVLGTTIFEANRRGFLHVGQEIRDARSLEHAPDAVVVGNRRRQREIAAVARAREHDPILVEARLRRDPIQQRANVLDGILAPHAVVEPLERLAEP